MRCERNMNLREGWAHYERHTGKASDVARQLAFAGLGLVWLLRDSNSDTSHLIPNELVNPSGCILLALVFDLAQYTVASTKWYRFLRKRERVGCGQDDELHVPERMLRSVDRLWLAKIASLGVAYFLLLGVMIRRLVGY